ncbi:hypothetical protein [Deinococcus knuensis]|uniref:Peroxin-14 n=1 Tax=Deinococcus knuensis TaxID=1837380 RepID=A0ABQ2SCJ8_9DEIO|nr:hypothetical protein [Deinococcus knuensis]GGS14853.1 hypothetical protein GCM10008961_02670 [Deinococcus knuensis]
MTGPTPKDPQAEAEFTRKMVLGILGTLEQKGLLSKHEVDSIIRAARHAAYPTPPRRTPGPAAPGTQWVKPDQSHQPMDRTTPIAIPNVQRAAPTPPGDQPKDKPAEETPKAPPVIDFDLQ